MNKRGKIALLQIIILITSIVSFSIIIQDNVSAKKINIPAGYEELSEADGVKDPGIYYNSNAPTEKQFFNSRTGDFGPFASIPSMLESPNPSDSPTPVKPSGFFSSIYGYGEDVGKTLEGGAEPGILASGSYTDAIVSAASWGMTAYGIVKFAGGMFFDDESTTNALSMAAGFGALAGKGVTNLLTKNPDWLKFGGDKYYGLFDKASSAGIATGVVVGAIIFLAMYKKEKQETVTFDCNVWEPPEGGEHCEECNEQGILPCSEYQCRSLGQACQLLNPGTGEERCAWVDRKDVIFPTIEPWEDVLSIDHSYNPDNTISPPDRGVKIVYGKSTTDCVKAFTPLSFGVYTNEPAQCKIDYERKATFDEMSYNFGDSAMFRYNHTQVMSLPGQANLEQENISSLEIQNDGNYELYVRCKDPNGNYNTANFLFKFCVEAGPDTTPPLIVSTNLIDGMPIGFNQSELDIELYVNEPANCKWSHDDKAYSDMENTMSCSSSVMEMNAQMLYTCKGTLESIKSKETNKFYFRCEDQPLHDEGSNVNQESYVFTVEGTQPLVIDEVGPNETIKDSTEAVKTTLTAETSAGYKEGEASCYYSDTGDEGSYIKFFNTDSYTHSQDLYLTTGNYEYWIKCVDLGGNTDIEITEFRVESDIREPWVVRAFHEETYLKLITDEEGECVYDVSSCSYLYDDGIKFTTPEEDEHYADWNTDTIFYVKCRDVYGNEPNPDECSIIVRPFDLEE